MVKLQIPAWMLNQTVSVEPFKGSGAYGPIYDTAYTLRCRVEPRTEVITDLEGNEVVAMGRLYAGPAANIPAYSRVTFDGTVYDVVRSQREYGPDGTAHHTEVWLR